MNIDGYGRSGDRKDSRTANGTANNERYPSNSRRMYGFRERNSRQLQHMTWNVTGGAPIKEPTAVALRRIVFGECPAPVKAEHLSRGPGLVFREAERDLGYALVVSHVSGLPTATSLMMAIQSHILRILLFDVLPTRAYKPNPLKPTVTMQQEALSAAIADIIWKAGGNQYGIICLPHPSQSHLENSDHFNQDGLTEKLHLFEWQKRDDLKNFVRRNLFIFQQDPGPALILLIYSAVLSRGIDRIVEDMGTRWVNGSYQLSLLSCAGDVSFSVLNLFLAGRAASHLHNGTYYKDNEDNTITTQLGIQVRSPIGLLIWMRNEEKTATYKLGSRLKTPLYPIWVVITSDQSGVLFSSDRNLLRDYRSEIRFELNYFTSSVHQSSPAVLLIRTTEAEETEDEVSHVDTLTKVIRTKWSGARILWNGVAPFL